MGSVIKFIGRLTLVVINLLLLVVSLVLFIVGFLVKYSSSTFASFTQPVLETIKKSSQDALGTALNTDEFSLDELFGPIAMILMIFGFVLLNISLFGCCGACCGIKKLLMLYAIILSVLVLGQIACVVVFFGYNDVLKNGVRDPLKLMINNYHGLNGTAIDSIAWNFLMQKFQCCGIDNYEDFDDTNWFGGKFGSSANMLTPFACCKQIPITDNFTCAETLVPSINNYNKGCLDAMWEVLLEQKKVYVYVGVCVMLLFQVTLIVLALVLYRIIKDDENHDQEVNWIHSLIDKLYQCAL